MRKLGILAVTALAIPLVMTLPSPSLAGSFDSAVQQFKQGSYRAAREQMKEIAETGHEGAQFYMGLMSHQGKGTPRNYREALKWYWLAADNGDNRGRNNLGVMYRDGLGITSNKILAYMWFSLAAADQSLEGQRNLERLSRALSQQDILQGQQLAEEYLVRLARHENDPAVLAASLDRRLAREPVKVIVVASADPRVINYIAKAPQVKHGEEPEETQKKTVTLAPLKATGPKAQYVIQLGLFSKASNVDRIEKRLQEEGISLMRERVSVRNSLYTRLRIGPYKSMIDAINKSQLVDRVFKIKSQIFSVDG